MAFSSRSIPSGHLRQTSVPGASTGMSLQARVNEKREELENLKQLRDLSAAVASQMEALEEKLSTLSDGTEGMQIEPRQHRMLLTGSRLIANSSIAAIATVMANWHNVLRAINMASTKLPRAPTENEDSSVSLPQMLVRIPTEHAPSLQAQADEAAAAAALEEEGEAS
ncbi:DASH complex subunit DAD2 [Sporothrix schenckii 1099-18]|uniref:DASH complex subunit DAD2 n=1 Tax=Sporothrix schenckii 1099-18 TaxID=1397361 RepID=A0A0F2MBG5_SPOSC|nr:DASH complex subunit DAD2 [Sporothrix schenckii 1099-18]KJR86967.1 DASH complex subunit DAD2 [Sporothrix schenckii 1099-18]